MKQLGSEGPIQTAAALRPHRPAPADRPTFSLALTLPVEWEPLAGPPTDALLDRMERSNGGILRTLLKTADLGAPPVEDEVLADALLPLRVKLDMVVEMLARLSYRDLTVPDPRPIELGLNQLRWTQPRPLAVDTWLLAKIYFHEIFREPIVLAGRVANCVPGQPDDTVRIEMDLAEMSEELGESFARLVFLEHRRHLNRHAVSHAPQRRPR
ncbi:MAG TPA: hypothetical protein VN632_05365 [Stellaceae bacterium]|nr:hypothetical protein [Stellaceae bacterium]